MTEEPSPGRSERVSDHLTKWIGAIAALIAALAAGGVIGHQITPSSSAAPAPTVTTTVFATQTVTAPSGGRPASGASPPTVTAGSKIGAYTMTISDGGVTLGTTKPSRDAYSPSCDSGDLCLNDIYETLESNSVADNLYPLVDGTVPSYNACMAVSQPGDAHEYVGTTFCLSKPGLLFGITITSAPYPTNLGMSVTVWANPSG